MAEGPLDDLPRWAAEASAGEAASARARTRWLRRQVEEEARWVGALLDLAERAVRVSLQTVSGRVLTGSLALVGRDVCALRTDGGAVTFLPLDAVDVAWPVSGDAAPATDARRDGGDVTLADVLSGLCDDETPVTLRFRAGGEPVSGVVRAIGDDVVIVSPAGAGARGRVRYARLRSISEISVRESG